MTEASTPPGFNEHHKRHIRVTFQCVDGLLNDVESVLANAGTPSPFREHVDDSSPVQRKVVHDYVTRLRETMRRVLSELEIPLSPPVCGALWAASTSLIFAKIHIEEMTPEHMAGYGVLPDEAKNKLHAICVEMQNALGKLNDVLSWSTGGDFQARLARLEQTSDEARLLRELERIVTAHGLVEFRGALSILLDRIESASFEIGVFGRVSSGKSSLLDYLLGTDALPVGVTPVTAIPTRIRFGSEPRARVEFAEAQPRSIGIGELSAFATEQQNPGNAKHVTRIDVQLPTPRLSDGIVFVDTPGLGSLAVAGAAETAAYLPRCDLGLVLVDASAGLTTDDLEIIQALYRAGATAMVLLSKADLFTAADRERMLAYVRDHVREQARVDPSIHAVSVVGADATLCDRWWEETLQPMLRAHRELATAARKRKIGGLCESVIASLELRLRTDDAGQRHASSTGAEALREAERALDDERHRTWKMARGISDAAAPIIAAFAEDLAHAWAQSVETDVARVFSTALARVLAEPVTLFLQSYEAVRQRLAGALAQAGAGDFAADLPAASSLPVLDATPLAGELMLERPKVLRIFGEGMLARHLRGKVEAQIGSKLRAFLAQHGKRLRDWMDRALQELKAAFDAAADVQRARMAPPTSDTMDRRAMEADLRLLRQWPSAALAIASADIESQPCKQGNGAGPPSAGRSHLAADDSRLANER